MTVDPEDLGIQITNSRGITLFTIFEVSTDFKDLVIEVTTLSLINSPDVVRVSIILAPSTSKAAHGGG